MRKAIKIFLFFVIITVLLGILYSSYILFGTNSINLKEITSSEKEEILNAIGLNNMSDNIELEKIETPKTYKDKYYVLYFSMSLNNNKDTLKNKKIDNLDIEFSPIEEKDNILKYRCTISNMGKNIKVLEQIMDKYSK